MREPYWHDKTHALYTGDPRQVLAEMPAGSADCIITSPPPWTPQPRDTTADTPSRYGREPTPALHLAALRRVFAQAHRVLTDQGTAWLITSDRYADASGSAGPPRGRHRRRIRDHANAELDLRCVPETEQGTGGSARGCNWSHLRRQSGQHGSGVGGRAIGDCRDRSGTAKEPSRRHDPGAVPVGPAGDVWSLPTRPQWHTLPIEVPLCCIAAGCRPGGTVLDMFAGIATTGIAARHLGRAFIGVEQTPALRSIAKRRLREDSGHGGNAR
ncbi:DNA-methyltransferase [Spirillospora sp. CA-128828]|uniref:DNA-methyltransferase n=1 Tax=Spirillospora sp. CA-128828 TaxID=3240033 RepID=UPI003D90C90A